MSRDLAYYAAGIISGLLAFIAFEFSSDRAHALKRRVDRENSHKLLTIVDATDSFDATEIEHGTNFVLTDQVDSIDRHILFLHFMVLRHQSVLASVDHREVILVPKLRDLASQLEGATQGRRLELKQKIEQVTLTVEKSLALEGAARETMLTRERECLDKHAAQLARLEAVRARLLEYSKLKL